MRSTNPDHDVTLPAPEQMRTRPSREVVDAAPARVAVEPASARPPADDGASPRPAGSSNTPEERMGPRLAQGSTRRSCPRPRRPRRCPADQLTLTFPHLPAALEGARILHLTDFHIRRRRPWYRTLAKQLASADADLVLLTGDYMSLPGDEQAALAILADLLASLNPRIAVYGSFGNHDTEAFKRRAMETLESVIWLEHAAVHLPAFDLTLIGTSTPGDLLRSMLHLSAIEPPRAASSPDAVETPGRPFRILLGHEPQMILPAARMGIDWVPCGHTHGGQFRFGLRTALHNSTDLPGHLSAGLLRLGDTLCTVSRGLGESILEFRVLCDRQMLCCTLQRGPMPGEPSTRICRLRWW